MVIKENLVVLFEYNGKKYEGMINRMRDIEYNCPGFWDSWLDTYTEEDWPDFRITGETDKSGNPTTDGLYIIAQDFEGDNEEHIVTTNMFFTP